MTELSFQGCDTSRKICQVPGVTHVLSIQPLAVDQISQYWIGKYQSVWFGIVTVSTVTEDRVDFISPSVCLSFPFYHFQKI